MANATTAQSGKLTIHSENIFPIIKKFLYSNDEVFLRELVSNATDAIQKLATLHTKGHVEGELPEPRIDVQLDAEAKTLTISDNGIGMTAEEVEKYINQIAFSSAEEFLEKYKDSGGQIIGHFGLGFYSAFMVADRVELITKSYQTDAEAVHWSCEGSTDYAITPSERDGHGTDVILHITDEAKEYLEEERIEHVLKKYQGFNAVPIYFKDKQVNDTAPAWTKPPTELSDDDYLEFYRQIFPMTEDPLFWIHLNVDYPFTLKGILYFPVIRSNMNFERDKIHLYQNQVFVTDNVENVVPEYLQLLRGVLDSPDIPLNVSRSYLQTDAAVRKISQHIAKKVADKLKQLFKDNREEFEKKWESFGLFVKFGAMRDDKFYERTRDVILLKNLEGTHFTIDEYKARVQAKQTDKDENVVMLYATDAEAMDSYIRAATARGYDVLLFDDLMDVSFLQHLEAKLENVTLKRVDADPPGKLIDTGVEQASKLNEDEEKELKELFEKVVDDQMQAIRPEPLEPEDLPVQIVKPEQQRRMSDMAEMGMLGGSMNLPSLYTVILNSAHPLMKRLVLMGEDAEREQLARHSLELALLAQGMLKGEQLTNFIQRNLGMMGVEPAASGAQASGQPEQAASAESADETEAGASDEHATSSEE